MATAKATVTPPVERSVSEVLRSAFALVEVLEATPGFEPGIKALQASALPLGDVALCTPERAVSMNEGRSGEARLPVPALGGRFMERTTGFEPATPTLARLCSTN